MRNIPMKEGRDLVKEALADAKSLREAAVESAKKEIVENLTPALRKLLDESLRRNLHERDRTGPEEWEKSPEGGTRQQKKDYGKLATNEADEVTEDLTLEDALQEFFPAEGVKENAMKSSKKSSVKENTEAVEEAKSSKKSSKKSSLREEIEISENELRKVYEAALQTEVTVNKGFKDLVDPFVELGGKTPGNAKNPPTPETGKVGGEHHFEEELPPHKQNWIPEAKQLQGMLQRGLAENKALRESLRKACTMIDTLGKKLHEVNLFNAKVLHVNKILNAGGRLTTEQKTFVMESIDQARSIGEVRMVYKTLIGSFKSAAAVNENRQVRPPKANASRPRTTGTPNPEVLSESVDKGQNGFSRVKELAGLLK
jgi:hypothetical protein